VPQSPRHASPQPNVPGEGIVAGYRPEFWAVVVGIGLAAGIFGAALMVLLRFIQRVAFGYHAGGFLHGVEQASDARTVLVLLAAGAIAGFGGLLLHHVRGSGAGEISDALWLGQARLPFWRSQARGLLSIVIVAMGASLGREAAPQLAGAAWATRLSEFADLPLPQRRLLVACGAGAGMAAVYNVPLGGALFALEVLLGTVTLPLVLPALATSLIATAVAWIVLPDRPIYVLPAYKLIPSQILWAALVGPVAGLAAVVWVRLITRVNDHKPSGRQAVSASLVIFTALGVVALAYPQLLGNGQDVVQLTFTGNLAVITLAVLVILKPLATAACLGSGAPGGLFTPTLAFGTLLGALLGHVWSGIAPGASSGSFAVIGGAAVLAASMQAPLAAVVLLLELTRQVDSLMVPMLLAVTEATVIARIIGAPSIYSARLGDSAPDSNTSRQCSEQK
jgi:CIC family chloride channel protein